MSTAQQAVIDAEANLKRLKAARDQQERADWKAKAQAIGKEAREAKAAFFAAKNAFAEAVAEQQQLNRRAEQIRVDLSALAENYQALEFPLAEETQEFEAVRAELLRKLEALREPRECAARKQGEAMAAEVREGGRYEQCRYAYRNALMRSRGERPGTLEGGVAFVS
jgi:hypothetical protein